MEAVECGAAALGSVLAYHGRVVPLEELRLACGVSRDGSKASNIVKAARSYGLVARGLRREPEDLDALPVPMIAHWGFNHFVVIEGLQKERVFLNDPASGPTVIPRRELDDSFTGIVLTFEPGPDFVRGGEFPSLARALRARLRGSESALAYAVVAGLCLVLPGLLIPAFTKIFINGYLVGGLADWLRPLLLAMGFTLALQIALSWLQQYHLMRLGQKLALSSAGRFFWHVLRLPIEFFNLRYAGDVASRAQLNDRIAQLLSTQLATNIVNATMIGFFAVIMVQYDVLLTAIGVGIAVLNILALRYVSRRRTDGNRRLEQEQGKLLSTAFGGLQMIETLKAAGIESDFFARWAGFHAKALNAEQELGAYTGYLNVIPPLLAGLGTVAILTVGGARIITGSLSIGALVAFQYLTVSFSGPINRLVSLGGDFQEAVGSMNRLDDVLLYPADPLLTADPAEGPSSETRSARLSGFLELRDVTFGYSRRDPPLIEHFHLSLSPGARVALVGGSGSGKSTVARLVAGLYRPWSGEILFDDRPRTAYPRPVIVASLALVDQEIFLFEGSVAENLVLWDPTVPENKIVRAARDAAIHDDIASRPNGYGSPVEEAGRNFSGGQRQRLEIARALVGDPALVVLDEATSALDPATEKAIDDNLRRRGCTCLIVAHRLSTIRDCDEIIVLDYGKVVQRGTHEQLRAESGLYERLIAAE
ncbi:MAG: NHLP family bacteriocin export ABC transporter peptidase/permease/ATPase subunit [Candidatus Dormibacteraeota bacterium]|nr:NHLP family bacteriocin export ABC transporter peptidase/permease/ATPase subunit [Candidatus Dormibacteraeota bacterium]